MGTSTNAKSRVLEFSKTEITLKSESFLIKSGPLS